MVSFVCGVVCCLVVMALCVDVSVCECCGSLRGCVFFLFFKQKTAYEIVDCDWSSDVCSSDLAKPYRRTGRVGDGGRSCKGRGGD